MSLPTPSHFIIVSKDTGAMIGGYFNRRWDTRREPESVIAADYRTGHHYKVVEVTASDLAAKTYTPAN